MPGRPLDHVVVAVADLDSAAADLKELGFLVTARSDHDFGTSNRLVVHEQSYVEMVTVTRPERLPESGFARFVADSLATGQEGPIMIVLKTADPAADRSRLRRLGLPDPEPMRFGRLARLPDGTEHRVEFISVFTDLGSPDLSAFLCQHLDPAVVWHPSTQAHPNGAHRLATITVEDPGPEVWQRLADMAETEPGPTIELGPTAATTGRPGLLIHGTVPVTRLVGGTLIEVAVP